MPKHERNDEPEIDRKVRPGDVAIDMAQGSWVYVVDLAAPEVAVWNRENDKNLLEYAGNWLCGATLGDRVFACVYLGGNGVKSTPSGSYDFPESRLARYPAEEANQDLRRVQTFAVRDLLTELLEDAKRADWLESLDDQDDPDIDSLADWLEEKAAIALEHRLGFPEHEDVLADSADRAEENHARDRERYEEMRERQAERDDAEADADSAAGSDDGDQADPDDGDDQDDQDGDEETETIEADLGTEDVSDPDDSGLETETTDSDEDDDQADGDLDEFEDFDA